MKQCVLTPSDAAEIFVCVLILALLVLGLFMVAIQSALAGLLLPRSSQRASDSVKRNP